MFSSYFSSFRFVLVRRNFSVSVLINELAVDFWIPPTLIRPSPAGHAGLRVGRHACSGNAVLPSQTFQTLYMLFFSVSFVIFSFSCYFVRFCDIDFVIIFVLVNGNHTAANTLSTWRCTDDCRCVSYSRNPWRYRPAFPCPWFWLEGKRLMCCRRREWQPVPWRMAPRRPSPHGLSFGLSPADQIRDFQARGPSKTEEYRSSVPLSSARGKSHNGD